MYPLFSLTVAAPKPFPSKHARVVTSHCQVQQQPCLKEQKMWCRCTLEHKPTPQQRWNRRQYQQLHRHSMVSCRHHQKQLQHLNRRSFDRMESKGRHRHHWQWRCKCPTDQSELQGCLYHYNLHCQCSTLTWDSDKSENCHRRNGYRNRQPCRRNRSSWSNHCHHNT